ncbi:hypothetical protein COV04_02795 [Candidatus Uhrbacteria bacterium CG10_big_fil_rev_8_21_14_0_10_48_11]|uniref:dTDP-4-dehydrorhamnose 3,5-epimerase n=1 Tax=Candidatus Uhrbacteria bacterium CG10_big_fil_rev_8_21_14_0_10_48_11 TaxID=1975037 RepID=A0A2M8LEI3_9BACT|nr:MAG: hypothetical protein COV04_02795 [Candidatus Uhrbacteria bacterium CG10_big_fil_rev_8_21_14_0_10_48_11]
MQTPTTTAIEGLVVTFSRFIADERGYLAELVPNGTDNPQAKEGIKNIYLSAATGNAPRAGHYHFRQTENFFVINGSALWAFYDYRKNSPTFGAIATVILTDGKERVVKGETPTYQQGEQGMPGITVPVGVYHVYWPLGKDSVQVICVASEPYDASDYVHSKPEDVPGIMDAVNNVASAV